MTMPSIKSRFFLALFAMLALFAFATPQSASALTPQTVTWLANNNLASLAASPLTPNSLATSNGPGAITYAVQDAGNTGCTVNPSTAVVTAAAHGLCVIRATAAETASYASAFVDKTFTFNINQTVTWSPNTTIVITGSPIVPNALASTTGTGAINYWVDTWNSNTGCSVDANTGAISVSNVGLCAVVASAPAGNGYNMASLTVNFTVTKAQTVTWNPPNTDLQLAWSPVTGMPAASSDGTGSLSYSVQSAGTTGCTINSSTRALSFTARGACVIRVTAAANGNWLAGFADFTFNIFESQSVSWMGANITQGSGTYTPTQATASGGGIIDYSVVSAGTTGCTIDPATAVITFTSVGQCQVKATARANGFYLAGNWIQANFNFYSNQTITWAPTNTTNSFSAGVVTPNATASNSGPGAITYSLAFPNAACSLNTSTGAISSSARGRCYVRANAATSGYYNGSSSSLVTFTFTGPQTVTWAATNTTNPMTRSVTANALPVSTGPITYSVANPGTAACSVNATTGTVSASAVGTCSIRATAAAVLTYESGFADLTFTFVEGQIITWPATNTSNPDSIATLTPNALASSNLGSAIAYSVQSAGTTGCTVNSVSAVITVSSAGVCVIRATAAANANVVSDYRDFSFTFTSSASSSLTLGTWNPRLVIAGSQPLISIFGSGFSNEAIVSIDGKSFAPKTINSTQLTFVLPKLSAGAHSFVINFGGQATVTFANAVRVLDVQPMFVKILTKKSSSANRAISHAENSLAKIARKVDVPLKLVCTAHVSASMTSKERTTIMTMTRRTCQQSASKVGAKVSAAKMLVNPKGTAGGSKLSLAIDLLG